MAKSQKIFLSQVGHLTISNMKSRYRKTFAGFIWVVINPLVLYGAQSLAFRKFLGLDVPNFFTYLLSGLLPWVFITQTAEMAAPLILSQGNLLKAMKVHPMVLLLAQILDNFVNFIFAFIILLIPIWLTERNQSMGLLFLPVGLCILILGVVGMSWFVSVANIFYRDISYVLRFLMSVMFFLTPIFYPASYVPPEYQWMIHINPFYGLILPVRTTMYNFNFEEMLWAFAIGGAWAMGFLCVAYIYWRRKKNMIYYNI